MTKLIAGSKAKDGARWQRHVADGYNPFGSSDYYISIYRGWVRTPKAGPYQFCTVSNKASFSFLDGKPLVHWPGQHTVERGVHGEVNAKVELTAGPALPGVLPRDDAAGAHGLSRLAAVRRRGQFLRHPGVVLSPPRTPRS